MKTIKIILITLTMLIILTSCGSASSNGSDPAPYGVDDRFLGMWEQVSYEITKEGGIEEEEPVDSAAATSDSAAQTDGELYLLFLPNGSVHGYEKYNYDFDFNINKTTWYTADEQILIMNGTIYKYEFDGKNTVVISYMEGGYNWDDDYNGVGYTEKHTVTLKRIDKHPANLPI